MKNKILILIFVVVLIALVSLLGLFNLTSATSNYVPIAPLTAIFLLFTCFNFSTLFLKKQFKVLFITAQIFAGLCVGVAFLSIINYFFITNWSIDQLVFSKIPNLDNVSIGNISPLSAFLVIGTNVSFLLVNYLNNYISLFISKFIFYIHFLCVSILLIGYISNGQFVYSLNILSLSFPSVIAFFILSLVQFHFIKYKVWPYSSFIDTSVQSKIVRSFIPVIIVFILIHSFIEGHLLNKGDYDSLGTTIVLVVFILLITYIIVKISIFISHQFQKSDSLYQSLFNNSTVGLYQISHSGKIISVNPTLLKILDFNSLEEIIDYKIFKKAFVNPSEKEKFELILKKNGEVTDFESEWYTKKGNKIIVKLGTRAIKNERGSVIRYDGVVEDITTKKNIENEIIFVKNELEDFFENDISADYLTNSTGEIINCNTTFLKLFGFKTIKDAKSSNFSILYKNIEERPGLLQELINNKKIINKEIDFITINGNQIHTVVNSTGTFNKQNELVKIRGYIIDITNLKKAKLDLKESDERFKLAAKATNEAIWECDLIKNSYWKSENFTTLFGWHSSELLMFNEFVNKVIHPDDKERVTNKIFNFFSNKNETWEDEYRILKKEGGFAWVFDRAYKIFDAQGVPIKIIGSMSDRTEKKLQENELKASEEKYRTILENTFIGVFESDLEGNILFSNKYLINISGFDNIDEINIKERYYVPSQRDNFINLLKEKGSITNFEIDFVTKQGNVRHCLINANLIEGKVIGMILDVTDVKNSKSELLKLSHAIEQSPVSILITDVNGVIEYSNPKVTEISGYKRNELIGKTPQIFKSGETSTEVYKKLWIKIKSGKSWFGEFHNVKKNGELFWERASISPVINSSAEITHFIAVKEDISLQKKVFNELMIAKNKAEESDRLKSAFLANMSHEIRTPMNGILGFSELLKKPNLTNEKQHQYIKIIEKSGARLLTTINDIIDISKIESGEIKLILSEVDINKQLNDLYDFFIPETEKKGLKLILKNVQNIKDLVIKSDGDKIYSILINLLKNAVKFTNKGTIEFGYTYKNNLINIYVKDTGIGIPLERQPYIFDRFVQADIEDKQVHEGSGLGLAISKAYAEILLGSLKFNSIENVGSTFYFELPIENSLKNIAYIHDNDLNEKEDFIIPKVLIVEDEYSNQLYLTELLKDRAKEILVASTGNLALQLYNANINVDLILMDIRLPNFNGYDITKKIRETNKNVIIIAQTALSLEGDREKALKAGCNNYISKPINRDKLFTLLNTYFGG